MYRPLPSDTFCMRPLMIGGGVLCCVFLAGCGSDKEPIRDDDPPAVVALKKAGANVEREANMAAPDMTGRIVDLSDTSLEPELFEHLPGVTGLTAILMTGPDVNDQTLALLPEIKGVTRIDLTGSNVTDEGLKHLRNLPSLTTVNLSDTQVAGPGLEHLSPRLSGLVLTNLPIDDADLEGLTKLRSLSLLVLTGTQVTPGGVKKLKEGRPFLITAGIKLN